MDGFGEYIGIGRWIDRVMYEVRCVGCVKVVEMVLSRQVGIYGQVVAFYWRIGEDPICCGRHTYIGGCDLTWMIEMERVTFEGPVTTRSNDERV